jgi:four helix bundle protein
MSERSIIKEKSFAFALRIVKLSKYLRETKSEYILSKQLLRSGTAIGALIREAKNAESSADFIHKFAIAQKECDETIYWLELLYGSEYITKKEYFSISSDANELLKMLRSSIITIKRKTKKQ